VKRASPPQAGLSVLSSETVFRSQIVTSRCGAPARCYYRLRWGLGAFDTQGRHYYAVQTTVDALAIEDYPTCMRDITETVDRDIVELIERTVRESMAPFGLRAVDVRAGEDHDGDPVIFVEAHYDLSERPIDPRLTAKLTSRLTTTLRDRLWERGEIRFPHVRHKFDERQKVVG
jgi:hypothetical protein